MPKNKNKYAQNGKILEKAICLEWQDIRITNTSGMVRYQNNQCLVL